MIEVSLTAAALEGEPWRLWTGHLAHWGTGHLTANVVAMLPPLLLLRRGESLRIALLLFLAAPLLSLAILGAGFDPYRGASGLVIGFWCAAAMMLAARREPVPALALLTLVAAKLALEASTFSLWSHEGFIVAPIAHQAGAVVGTIIGMTAARFAQLFSPRGLMSG